VSHARDDARLVKLQTELDAAVLDGSRWRNVCDTLAGALEGAGTMLIPFDPEGRAQRLVSSDALGEITDRYVQDGWYKRDYREATVPFMRRRGYATDYDVADRDTLRRHAYYQDFVTRIGFGVFIGIHIPTDDGDWCASIQRPLTAGDPSRSVLERIPQFRAMLTGAVRASKAIGASGLENWRSHFDSADRGFALLKRDGRISEMNAVAEGLLAPFMQATGELALRDQTAGARLAELTARACAPALMAPLPPPVLLQLTPGRALAIDVAPLPSGLRHFHIDVVAVMTIRHAETPIIDQSARLARQLGLTAAEARLALRLGDGESLRDAADAEAVTYETARTRLKAIFAKTGLGRQAELVLLIARIGAR
jgi:DNA-binding CsgD family transcriptional regulator